MFPGWFSNIFSSSLRIRISDTLTVGLTDLEVEARGSCFHFQLIDL